MTTANPWAPPPLGLTVVKDSMAFLKTFPKVLFLKIVFDVQFANLSLSLVFLLTAVKIKLSQETFLDSWCLATQLKYGTFEEL